MTRAEMQQASEEQEVSTVRNVQSPQPMYNIAVVGMSGSGKSLAAGYLYAHHGYRITHELHDDEQLSDGSDDESEDEAIPAQLPWISSDQPHAQCVAGEGMPAFSDPVWIRYACILLVGRGEDYPQNMNPLHRNVEVLCNNSTQEDLYHCIDRLVHRGTIRGDVRCYSAEAEDRWQERQRGHGSA